LTAIRKAASPRAATPWPVRGGSEHHSPMLSISRFLGQGHKFHGRQQARWGCRQRSRASTPMMSPRRRSSVVGSAVPVVAFQGIAADFVQREPFHRAEHAYPTVKLNDVAIIVLCSTLAVSAFFSRSLHPRRPWDRLMPMLAVMKHSLPSIWKGGASASRIFRATWPPDLPVQGLQHDDEFIAASPGDGVFLAPALQQPRRPPVAADRRRYGPGHRSLS